MQLFKPLALRDALGLGSDKAQTMNIITNNQSGHFDLKHFQSNATPESGLLFLQTTMPVEWQHSSDFDNFSECREQ